ARNRGIHHMPSLFAHANEFKHHNDLLIDHHNGKGETQPTTNLLFHPAFTTIGGDFQIHSLCTTCYFKSYLQCLGLIVSIKILCVPHAKNSKVSSQL
ncbi:hypothetical protein ACJX0J_031093, partial [Zea mays]